MSYEAFDHLEVRCPQLGGEVSFGYCRKLGEGMPCPKALDCWYFKFPVEKYFRLVLEEATFERIFLAPPVSRVERLLNTVSEAQERLKDQS